MLSKRISNLPNSVQTLFAAVAAFCTYLCFYPFRRAYTAATFEELYFWGIHFKILIITAQVLGFAVSKGIGIKIVSEMKPENRAKGLLLFTGLAWICMLFFGSTPAPYNLIFVFLGSLPLGLFYGVILGFLEGRKSTDLLVAALTASFIIGSGFAKSIGKWVLSSFDVSEFLMPFVADSIMYIPLAISVWFLAQIPRPSEADKNDRVERLPMNKNDRKAFRKEFGIGLVLFIASYVLLTAYREFRDNFMPEILQELGYGVQTALFTKTEIPIAVVVLLLMASMRWIKNHAKAFVVIQSLLLLGAIIIGVSTILFQMQIINPILWLICVGFGAYVAYSMCNSIYFERMLAAFKYSGTVGFMITLADYYAYFGSVLVLFYKNFFQNKTTNVNFFIYGSYALAISYFLMVLVSMFYFKKKAIANH
ncbi:DUF5690 family protein [Lacihabitans sp. CCS-44]|uniref:DUF5690 family protein n=1 Tax=Lacihabitans sp. CCS-44 TaxID=2487331 RepID=UPI0020CD66A4|nr:DUF5690 family protein [Lacihabitans sp. CCS-44]